MFEKINKDTYFLLSILIVGVSSFLLGSFMVYFAYNQGDSGERVVLEELDQEVQNIRVKQIYASKRGSKYYPWWCSAGKSIAEKNKVWYSSTALAEAAGYTIAKSCK